MKKITSLFWTIILGIALVMPNTVVSQTFEPSLPIKDLPATVVDIIVGSDVHTTLATAVVAADLAGALSGEGPFTVFAPTDDAFAALPDGLLDDLLAEPEGLLTDILLYHVAGAYALSTDLSDGQEITTLFGDDVVVTINDDGVFINDAQVIVADLLAENGVVHVIDAVLVPSEDELPATVVDIIVGSDVHTTLATAVVAADLAGALSGEGPFTVFAPTDDAFAALPDGLLDDLLADPDGLLTDILLYHVVGAYALSTDLSNGQEITTLFGQDVVVTINDDGVFINDAQVIIADLLAENGVVHVIDAVLVPSDDTTNIIDVIDVDAISINVYPNPSSSVVNVSSSEDINNIRIIDITGRVMQDIAVSGTLQALLVNNLPNGVYFLQVTTNAGILTERIQVAQ